MNRDMEEKGIVLRELSSRTAAELTTPELPASATVQLPEYTRRSSRKASAAAQLPEYTAGAAGLPASAGGSLAVVWQLSSGSTIPFSGVKLTPPELPPKGSREEETWSRKGLYSRS